MLQPNFLSAKMILPCMKRHHILLEVGKHKVFPMEEHPELRAEGTFEHPLKAPLSAIQ